MELSIKNILIKKMVREKFSPQDKLITESDISKVINHQFDGIEKAFVNNNSVEITGFGKFLFRLSSAEKYMAKYRAQVENLTKKLDDPNLSETQRRNVQILIANVNGSIKVLKPKIDKAHEIK